MSPKLLVPLAIIAISGAALADAPANKPMHKTLPAHHMAAVAGHAAAPLPPEAVRDWRQVDADHDNLVSPDEMEKYLAANPGPLKKPS